jgi:recombination protein RecA
MSVTPMKKSTEMSTNNTADKNKALDAALAQIERAFGKGSIMKLTGDRHRRRSRPFPRDRLVWILRLGIGGVPRGRIVEIYGPESSGKTTLALQVIAEAQKAGGTCAIVDAEHALDPTTRANSASMSMNLLISQPDARGAGARNRRYAGALRCAGCAGDRLRGRAGAQAPNSKARWAIPMSVCRPD